MPIGVSTSKHAHAKGVGMAPYNWRSTLNVRPLNRVIQRQVHELYEHAAALVVAVSREAAPGEPDDDRLGRIVFVRLKRAALRSDTRAGRRA